MQINPKNCQTLRELVKVENFCQIGHARLLAPGTYQFGNCNKIKCRPHIVNLVSKFVNKNPRIEFVLSLQVYEFEVKTY